MLLPASGCLSPSSPSAAEAISALQLAQRSEDLVINLNLVGSFKLPPPPSALTLRGRSGDAFPQYTIQKSDNWSPGGTLKICFFDIDKKKSAEIEAGFREWESYISLSFDLGQKSKAGTSYHSCATEPLHFDIRVGYSCASNWSVYGRQAHDLKLLQDLKKTNKCVQEYQTMNIGVVNDSLAPDIVKRARILHEIGHSLGFMHEHQRIDSGCKGEINEPKVKEALVNQGYTLEQFKLNYELFEIDSKVYAMSPEADRKSIMNVFVPATFLYNGKSSPCYIEERYDLSDLDKAGAELFFRESGPGPKSK